MGLHVLKSLQRVNSWLRLKHILQTQKHIRTVLNSVIQNGVNGNRLYSDNSGYVVKDPEFDWDYLADPANKELIHQNILNRKGDGDIHKVQKLWDKYQKQLLLTNKPSDDQYLDENITEYDEDQDYLHDEEDDLTKIRKELIKFAKDIPNKTHPKTPIGDEDNAITLATVGKKREFKFKPKGIERLGENLGVLRTSNVNISTGPKSYYLIGEFAKLQSALVYYTIDYLETQGFELVYVPELVHPAIVEGCGFKPYGERTQVYHIEGEDISLAGTGELPLAALHMDEILSQDKLPKKYTTVSTCYRAESSTVAREQGIYRVHQFKKVEMFALTENDEKKSEHVMEEIITIQTHLFSQLGLHFRVLEMPSHELGAPAYRKVDMETWMPKNMFWGEISSTSNCIDFQSRRLNLKYWDESVDKPVFTHTVNGTGCAVPRLVMAIAENFQTQSGDIEVPEVLHPYMNGTTVITKPENPIEMTFKKLKRKKDMKKEV